MPSKLSFRHVMVAAAFFLVGCANSATVQNESLDSGTTRTFEAPFTNVTAAAVEGLKALNLDVTKATDETDKFTILFVRPMNMWQWGGVGRLVVDKSAAPPTTVTVNYDRRFGGGAGQGGYAAAIFKKMDELLQTSNTPVKPTASAR